MAKIGKGAKSVIVKKISEAIQLAGKKNADELINAARKSGDDFVPDPTRVVTNPTYARPSGYRSGVRDQVWNDAIEPSTGRVRDPLTGRFMSKDKPWDMGHRDGHEFWKHQQSAEDRGITRSEFLDEHNVPEHYRPELPKSNQGHKAEAPDDIYYGP